MTHAWCSDPSRDERVRAAEDGRTAPLPTLEEAIARAFGFDKASAQRACDEVKSWPEDVQKDCRFVLGDLLEQGVDRLQALVEAWRYGKGLMGARYPEMIPKSVSASSPVEQENKGDGMRTERVTLEITHDGKHGPVSTWPFECGSHGKCVRVVEEAHFDDLAQVAMERDAAIRERDNERLLRIETETYRDFAIREKDSAIFHITELRTERDALQARVAELEAASGGEQPYMITASGIPLYRSPPQPRGWLTGEESALVKSWERHYMQGAHYAQSPSHTNDIAAEMGKLAEVCKSILARSTPPEVDLPISLSPIDEELIRAALAAAGVAVKEGQ